MPGQLVFHRTRTPQRRRRRTSLGIRAVLAFLSMLASLLVAAAPSASAGTQAIGAPNLKKVTYAEGGAALFFTAPRIPATARITHYNYQLSCTGGVTLVQDTYTSSTTSPLIVGGRCPQGRSGIYRIAAGLDATTGAWSNWRRVGPPIGAPYLRKVTYAEGGAALYFTAPRIPTAARITHYYYQLSCNGGVTLAEDSYTSSTTSPLIVGGRCPQGRSGTYRIAAELDATTGAWSNWRRVR